MKSKMLRHLNTSNGTSHFRTKPIASRDSAPRSFRIREIPHAQIRTSAVFMHFAFSQQIGST